MGNSKRKRKTSGRKQMPILTSGQLLVELGLIEPPQVDVDDESDADWAEVYVIDVNEDEASLLGDYWESGYARYLRDGEKEHLKPFEGEQVGGLILMTDPELIEEFASDYGSVDVREMYEPGAAQS